MKNAKRLLALVMVIAMLMSYVVIPASAAEDAVTLDVGVEQTLTVPAEGTAAIKVDATEGELILTVSGGMWDWYVLLDEVEYYPNRQGSATVDLAAGKVYELSVVSTNTESALELTASVAEPVYGTMDRPDALVIGNNVVAIEAGAMGEYFYTWTAETCGELALTVGGTSGWQYCVNNLTAGVYGDYHWSDENITFPELLTVATGDVIEVRVITYDPADMWNIPAGEITVSASFEASHKISHKEAIEPGCHYKGQKEHWVCELCEIVWEDEALTKITNRLSVVIAETGSENLQHVTAIAADCHDNGNIQYWYCPDCDQYWQDEALTQLTNSHNVIIPAVGSENVNHVNAVAPTCHINGNIEYWYCEDCGRYWEDEALTKITNVNSVIAPATVVEYVPATKNCHEDGLAAHYYCEECDAYFFADENGNLINTNVKRLTLEAEGKLTYMAAVAPTCHAMGNIEHYYCEVCGDTYVADEPGNMIPVPAQNVILAATGAENMTKVAAVAATCCQNGNYEYYTCDDCGGYFTMDENGNYLETNAKNVVESATSLEYAEEVPACHENGIMAHWYCTNPEHDVYYVTGEDGNLLPVAYKSLTIEATVELTHVEAAAPTCHGLGNLEHWYCEVCGDHYADAEGKIVTTAKEVTLAATGTENMTKVEAVAPTCHVNGNEAHYICGDCGAYFLDEEGTQLTNALNVVIPATTVEYVEEVPACHLDGMKEHYYCAKCDSYFTADEEGNLVNVARLSLVIPADEDALTYVEEVPACHVDGMKEHYYCAGCDNYFEEVNGNLVNSNRMNLVIPAVYEVKYVEEIPACHKNGMAAHWYCEGCEAFFVLNDKGDLMPTASLSLTIEGDLSVLEHYEAVEPTCHGLGSIEHWYCAECDGYYADAEGKVVTNGLSIILPAKGTENMTKVAAVEATCHVNGNVEHYICGDCGGYYLDAEGTQLTNVKNVITPATALEYVEEVPACHVDGTAAHWYCSECDTQFTEDENGNLVNTNLKNLTIPANVELEHNLKTIAGLHTDGMEEHWYCSGCDCYFVMDEAGNYVPTARLSLVLTAEHAMDHYEEVPACHMDGVPEYWYCAECDVYLVEDENGNRVNTGYKSLVIPGSEEHLEYVEEVPACHMDGMAAHWYCADCDSYLIKNEDGNYIPTNIKSLTLVGDISELKHVDEVPACHADGMAEHFYCEGCENYYVYDDNNNLVNTNRLNLIIPGDGKLLYVPYVAPTATENGMMAHFYCDGCDCYFIADDNGNMVNVARLSLTILALDASDNFVDVEDGAWYEAAVEFVVEAGLMNGTSETTFAPNANMTREMVWTVLARIDGETISGDTWAADAKAWAVENEVSDGTNPTAEVTREQLVTMIWRYYGETASDFALDNYADAGSVSSWVGDAMAWAVENGVINGTGEGLLDPQGTATRAMFAQILMNYLAK